MSDPKEKIEEPGKAEAKMVTAEDLTKTLKEIEGVKEEPKPEPESKPETLQLKKSAEVMKDAPEKLRKAIEVSDVLDEFTKTMGLHVDSLTEMMEKTVNGQANVSLGIVRALESMKKSIDSLSEQVKTFGELPGRPAGAGKAKASDIAEPEKKQDGMSVAQARTRILEGATKLAKSASPGTPDSQYWTNVAVKFETSGHIEQTDLKKVLEASK